jgi:hypothetical protein
MLEGPFGKSLTYGAIIGVLDDALRATYLRKAWHPWIDALAAGALGSLVARPRRSRRALLAGAAALAALPVGAFALLCASGAIVAVPTMLAILTAGVLTRAASDMLGRLQERVALAKDLELGRLVQALTVPERRAAAVGGWEYSVHHEPYGAMSGDWFQVWEAPPGSDAVAVIAAGDVVGKGPSAALITALIAGQWQEAARGWGATVEPTAYVAHLNRMIWTTFREQQYSTLNLAVLRESSIDLLAIGGPRWLRFTANASGDLIGTMVRTPMANPVGSRPSVADDVSPILTVEARPGDLFLCYTDGVLDSALARTKMLKEVERSRIAATRPDATETIVALLRKHGAGSALPDDATVVVVRRPLPAEKPSAVPIDQKNVA